MASELLESPPVEENNENIETLNSISVKAQSGAVYSLKNVELTATVFQIKELVAKQDGSILPQQIKLIHRGSPLNDDKATVKEVNISDGATLFFIRSLDNSTPPVSVEAPQPEPTKAMLKSIVVKTQGGTQYTLEDIDPSAKVSDLKTLVANQDEGLSASGIKFIFKGKPLNDEDATCESLNITDGSTIFMVKRLDNADLEHNSKVGVDVNTNVKGRGRMRFRVPQGGPGNRVSVQPPSGPAFMVQVPATARVGDVMEVAVPEPTTSAPQLPPQNLPWQNSSVPQQQQYQPPPQNNPYGSDPNTQLMKVVCPPNARPGQQIEMMVPNIGRMRVTVPQTAIPGQPFFFRVRRPGV